MMWDAERPFVYAGGGIIHSGASMNCASWSKRSTPPPSAP
jgi:glyoxylate carboligase